jgi:hypothetical protein
MWDVGMYSKILILPNDFVDYHPIVSQQAYLL